jgi:hypothetical protein
VDLLLFLVVLSGFTLVMCGLLWLARRVRRKGIAFVGPADELFHPAAHQARLENEVQEERISPSVPTPDDK